MADPIFRKILVAGLGVAALSAVPTARAAAADSRCWDVEARESAQESRTVAFLGLEELPDRVCVDVDADSEFCDDVDETGTIRDDGPRPELVLTLYAEGDELVGLRGCATGHKPTADIRPSTAFNVRRVFHRLRGGDRRFEYGFERALWAGPEFHPLRDPGGPYYGIGDLRLYLANPKDIQY